jgi:uncharacterized tellurite resistance protein B-like protein
MPIALHTDSPEAMARILALMMVADTDLDEREVRTLEDLDAFNRIGMPRSEFMRVAKEFCADLGRRMGEQSWLRLSDIELIDSLLDDVRDPRRRLLVSRLAAGVITADGQVSELERMVYDHMLCRWGLTRSVVSKAIREDRVH